MNPGDLNQPPPFPNFASLAEAEAYSEKTGDDYYEICYHLEGNLNLCLQAIHDLYAQGPPSKRPRMQTGLVREILCPEGWPKYEKTLVYFMVAATRFSREHTCHAFTVNEAMAALFLENEIDPVFPGAAYNSATFEPLTPADAEKIRGAILRLCDWIESRIHRWTHAAWYRAPDLFDPDPRKSHLAKIGIAQRHLAVFSERDRQRWEEIHARAAAQHGGDLKLWSTVGKVQHDPGPRTWTHPEVDPFVIGLWPLVTRYNWTYGDLLKVLDQLMPSPSGGADRRYPLDSVESLKVHCRTICGLTKLGKGKSAQGFPLGWEIAKRLFTPAGK